MGGSQPDGRTVPRAASCGGNPWVSGAPAFQKEGGSDAVVGVVSWSTGPGGSDGCGGLTRLTPLVLYRL
jgi:hypothetical protein